MGLWRTTTNLTYEHNLGTGGIYMFIHKSNKNMSAFLYFTNIMDVT